MRLCVCVCGMCVYLYLKAGFSIRIIVYMYKYFYLKDEWRGFMQNAVCEAAILEREKSERASTVCALGAVVVETKLARSYLWLSGVPTCKETSGSSNYFGHPVRGLFGMCSSIEMGLLLNWFIRIRNSSTDSPPLDRPQDIKKFLRVRIY